MTVLNTIVANQLQAFKKEVDSRNQHNPDTEANIVAVLQGYKEDGVRIVFNGNGYSEDWEKEAGARRLSNNKTTPVALKAMISKKSKEVFENQHVRLIPLHPVTQYEGATQLSVGERVVGRESALCLGLSRVAALRA